MEAEYLTVENSFDPDYPYSLSPEIGTAGLTLTSDFIYVDTIRLKSDKMCHLQDIKFSRTQQVLNSLPADYDYRYLAVVDKKALETFEIFDLSVDSLRLSMYLDKKYSSLTNIDRSKITSLTSFSRHRIRLTSDKFLVLMETNVNYDEQVKKIQNEDIYDYKQPEPQPVANEVPVIAGIRVSKIALIMNVVRKFLVVNNESHVTCELLYRLGDEEETIRYIAQAQHLRELGQGFWSAYQSLFKVLKPYDQGIYQHISEETLSQLKVSV